MKKTVVAGGRRSAAMLSAMVAAAAAMDAQPIPREEFVSGRRAGKTGLAGSLRRRERNNRPHQGGWECERRRLQARGLWPWRFEIDDLVVIHRHGASSLEGAVEDVMRGGDLHLVRLLSSCIDEAGGVTHVMVPKAYLNPHPCDQQ